MVGPTPSAAASSSSVAAMMRSIDRKSRASACAAVGPTWRMDSATSTRQSGTSLRVSRLTSSFAPLAERAPSFFVKNAARCSFSSSRKKMSPSSCSSPLLQQRDRRLVAEVLDVEGAAAGDVEHPLPQLRGAGPGVRAADVGVALLLRAQLGAALGAVAGHLELALGAVARRRRPGPSTSGMTSPALRMTTVSPISTPLRLTSDGVVQGGQLHGGAGDLDRLHVGEGGDPAGAADVDPDVEELGRRLLRRVLERDRPARGARGRAQPPLQRVLVDLHDDAVDLVLDRVPLLLGALDELPDTRQVVDHPEAVAHRQPERAQPVVGRRLPVDLEAPVRPDAVHHQPQRPGGGDPRVLLPERAGGGVARVGERRLALLDHAGVDVGEGRDREVDLAAHLEQLRDVVPGQLLRDALHRADVGGDVLPRGAVAAGGGAHQPALLVDDRDRDAVDLELAQEAGARAALPLDAGRPGGQLVAGEGVVQALHPLEVLDRRERGGEAAVDLLARRLGGDEGVVRRPPAP